jgi:thiamine biosynthesis protein ThiI
MRYNLIIARFSEIAVKSGSVRKRLIKILVYNIKKALKKSKVKADVYAKWERIFIETKQIKKSVYTIKHVFGIVSISPAIKVQLAMLEEEIERYAKLAKNKKFAVRVKRVGQHPFTSKEMEAKLGSIVETKAKSTVDLTNPEITFFVEIRNEEAYLYFETIPGPGGMPLGSEERVVCVINNKKDLIACWLMMKKGCRVRVYASISIKPLKKWMYGKDVKIISKTEAEKLAKNLPLVSGNTLKDGFMDEEGIVFYPLFAMTEEEIKEIYRKINI